MPKANSGASYSGSHEKIQTGAPLLSYVSFAGAIIRFTRETFSPPVVAIRGNSPHDSAKVELILSSYAGSYRLFTLLGASKHLRRLKVTPLEDWW